MSDVQEFFCQDCMLLWRDKYSFWNGYQSTCPSCGNACKAVCDTQVYDDEHEMAGLYDGRPVDFEVDDHEKTEAALEGERDQIRDEIVEALGAVEPDASDTDDRDADAEPGGNEAGEGF